MPSDKSIKDVQTPVQPPAHPVPQLQKPFEESMIESINNQLYEDVPADAMTRRTMLLEAPTYQRVIAGRWTQKPGEKYHPLWKLVAQMSFGMHLLAHNMAISEEEVMRILQSHVDDIDGFLERTTEDFDLAQSDIHERIRCLKLPLAHGEVFDRMLEDRAFRASILDGNEKIDHVIGRTKRATKDALKDVQKGFDATNVLEKYLTKLSSTWRRESPEHEAVLVAMLGNVEGWRTAFLELHLQGNKLAGSLTKLGEIVSEMEQRAAVVSRNLIAKAQKSNQPNLARPGRAQSRGTSLADLKPLPSEPGRQSSSRPSSRGTQITAITIGPSSGRKSVYGMAAHSTSSTSQLQRSPEGKGKLRAGLCQRSYTSPAMTQDEPRVQHALQRPPAIKEFNRRPANNHPIELPADVPQEMMRQAPVSVKNRLSMTLGLMPRDNSEHRASSIYYPKALGDLLKSPAVSGLLPTPQSTQSKGTPVQDVTTSAPGSGTKADYFTSHEGALFIGMITPDNNTIVQSNRSSPPAMRGSAHGSIVGSSPATRRSSLRNPAFTSHPAVMSMATPPTELPADDEHEIRPSSSNTPKDLEQSDLGEPGPEMPANIATEPTYLSEAGMVIDLGPIAGSTPPLSSEESSSTTQPVFEKPGNGTEQSGREPEPSVQLVPQLSEEAGPTKIPVEEVVAAISFVESTSIPDKDDEKVKSPPEGEAHRESTTDMNAAKPEETCMATQSAGDVEESVPAPSASKESQTQSEKEPGPVELEAQASPARMPPTPAEQSQGLEKGVPQADMTALDDFLKIPAESAIKPGLKPRDFGDSDTPQPIRPLKLKLAKKDGKIVPVQVDSAEEAQDASKSGSKLKLDLVADVVETMSHTPTGSPCHSSSPSFASSNSAQQRSHPSSSSLPPPQEASAPSGPAGRPMVDPGTVAAEHLDGDRKSKKNKKGKKKSSLGSKSGWKSLFGGHNGNTNTAQSSGSSSATPVSEHSKTPSLSGPESLPSVETITASGKDQPWFKSDAKPAVDVTSA